MKLKKSTTKLEYAADWVGDGFLLAARRLREIQDVSPDDFKIVAKILKIKYRKALYLAQIDRTFRDLGVDGNALTAVGWTKLQLLCGHVNKSNCSQMIKIAASVNVPDLKRILRAELPLPDAHCVVLYFSGDQYEVFKNIIIAHGGSTSGMGLVDKETALMAALSATQGSKQDELDNES